MFKEQCKRKLCDITVQKQADNVYITLFRGLSLSEYVTSHRFHCHTTHAHPCTKCSGLSSVASHVLEHGSYSLSEAYKTAFPHLHYRAQNALQLLLQMPLAGVRVGTPESGISAWYLLEYIEGVNYIHVVRFLEATVMSRQQPVQSIKKHELKALLGLAQSDRERELIRFSAFRSSGLSVTGARRHLGLENMQQRSDRILQCIEEAQEIRDAVDKLSCLQDKALLSVMGLSDAESSTAESELDDCDVLSDVETSPGQKQDYTQLHDTLLGLLKDNQYNWFAIVDFVENNVAPPLSETSTVLDEFYSYALSLHLTKQEKSLLTSSYAALQVSQPSAHDCRTASLLNGDIVSDSESDNAEDYVDLHSLASERAKRLVAKRRAINARRMHRYKAKKLAERNFLARRKSKQVQSIVTRFPDIGEVIEMYVSECNIGADAWRRTGILTFDGNIKIREKVTYGRIQQHLLEKYQCKISYGTVVQLCVARNKRRRSAKNYKGVAKVTTRRARKGFEMKFNPDKHWSCALYRNLNLIQYTDGSNIANINRDDASGFRLDTLATHSKHGTAAVQGKNVLTTHTDYVNKHPSVLQVTSYNFSATKSTNELSAGVVKGSKVFPKNAAQHYADLEMLTRMPAFKSVFFNSVGSVKDIECVRVDGAGDEGPSHEEVKFWWAARHLEQGNVVTLLTSRASGSSYLNRVELQNGCLALGHTNLFIPSTLGGSVYNEETGQIDMNKVRKNLDMATSVYIERVNNCPFGETVIKLFKGADSSEYQRQRQHLIIYLKGSGKKRDKLQSEQPQLFAYFDKVTEVKRRHQMGGLPSQYLFYLVCCFQSDCPHPVCRNGERTCMRWFDNGPSVTSVPLPTPDPSRPWGGSGCNKCSGFCAGHYLMPQETIAATSDPAEPPSSIMKKFYTDLKGKEPSESELEDVARKCLLPIEDVSLWMDHLKTVQHNRKRGAAKAAESRKSKRHQSNCTSSLPSKQLSDNHPKDKQPEEEQEDYYCGTCEGLYGEGEEEYWIGCDGCFGWFHGECVSVTPETEPETFFCPKCLL